MRIQEFEPDTFAETLAPEWESFGRGAKPTRAFLHPQYVACWLARLGKGSTPHLVTAWERDKLVGYAPFLETADSVGPFEEPTLRFVGNNLGFPGDLMYAEILTKGSRGEIIKEILSHADDQWRVPKWNLGFVHPDSETSKIAAGMIGQATGDGTSHSQHYPSLDLPTSFEAYLGSLSPNVRQNHRRRSRRLRERGDLQMVVDRQPGRVGARMQEMLDNHLRWWQGTERQDWFGDTRTRDFLVSCAEQLAALGNGVFFTLELDGQPISWNAGCLDDGRYFEQLISFDRDYAAYSPGILLSVDLIRYLINLGVRRVDLGPGLNERKRALGGIATAYPRIEGYVRTPPLKARLVRRLRGRSRYQ